MRVTLPSGLAELADGALAVDVPGAPRTVREAFDELGAVHPGVRDSLLTERGELRPHVNVFVNGDNIRFLDGLATPVAADAEIFVLPAVSGG